MRRVRLAPSFERYNLFDEFPDILLQPLDHVIQQIRVRGSDEAALEQSLHVLYHSIEMGTNVSRRILNDSVDSAHELGVGILGGSGRLRPTLRIASEFKLPFVCFLHGF